MQCDNHDGKQKLFKLDKLKEEILPLVQNFWYEINKTISAKLGKKFQSLRGRFNYESNWRLKNR